jgi:long-chain acyl-CoA synthetase
VALITLREEALQAHLKTIDESSEQVMQLIIDDFKSYTRNPRIKGYFPLQWQPRCFMVVPGSFSEVDGTINSTLKMVRHVIMQHHGHLIEAQYTSGNDHPDNPHNRAVLRVRFFA